MMEHDGVLLVAHGSVASSDDIPSFLRQIRRGRPPSEELIREMAHRYDAIGGSPLLQVTREQATALGAELGCPASVGMRFGSPPTIADGLGDAQEMGVRRLCVVPMAPFSVHVYDGVTRQVVTELEMDLELVSVDPWGSEPKLVAALADTIEPHLTRADTEALILSAHSLPLRAIQAGDPYQRQFEESANLVLQRLRCAGKVVYQSQGDAAGQWLGPTVEGTLKELAAEGKKRVVIAPIGFPCDHVETLYDLDVEARAQAEDLGLEFVRVPALNADLALISVLASVVKRAFS